MRNFKAWSALVAAVALTGGLARADDELPVYRVLPCAVKCANAVPAVAIEKPAVRWPAPVDWEDYAEGFVDVQYTIGTDGHVRDASVMRSVAPQAFAKVATDTIERWTFTPATVDGKPVESTRTVRIDFRAFPGAAKAASIAVAAAYDVALRLVREGKDDEALAKLADVQAKTHLSYYERTMISYARALIYAKRKDLYQARWNIDIATMHQGADLDAKLRVPAIRHHIEFELQMGEIPDALEWLDVLKKRNEADTDIVKFVDAAMARAAALDAIFVSAWIPPQRDSDVWWHTLYRRSYAFANVEGKLDRFLLACDQQSLESPISETAEWHVPADWSNCRIFVHGTPGTKFDLVETK